MAYRRTKKVEERLAETRGRIVKAALSLVAKGGFGSVGMPAIAAEAGVATGLLYRYFSSKADLFNDVFRHAAQREIEACAAAASISGNVRKRLTCVVETFAWRALRGRTLAWALLAEPVDRLVQTDRLHFRETYRAIFAELIGTGIHNGEVALQDTQVMAAALVGAIAEALVGPLSEPPHRNEENQLVACVARFCVQSLGPVPSSSTTIDYGDVT